MMLVSVTAMSCVFHPRPQVFFWAWFVGTEDTWHLTLAKISRLTNPHLRVWSSGGEQSISHVQLLLFFFSLGSVFTI